MGDDCRFELRKRQERNNLLKTSCDMRLYLLLGNNHSTHVSARQLTWNFRAKFLLSSLSSFFSCDELGLSVIAEPSFHESKWLCTTSAAWLVTKTQMVLLQSRSVWSRLSRYSPNICQSESFQNVLCQSLPPSTIRSRASQTSLVDFSNSSRMTILRLPDCAWRWLFKGKPSFEPT